LERQGGVFSYRPTKKLALSQKRDEDPRNVNGVLGRASASAVPSR
jgi:hypothetical protein